MPQYCASSMPSSACRALPSCSLPPSSVTHGTCLSEKGSVAAENAGQITLTLGWSTRALRAPAGAGGRRVAMTSPDALHPGAPQQQHGQSCSSRALRAAQLPRASLKSVFSFVFSLRLFQRLSSLPSSTVLGATAQTHRVPKMDPLGLVAYSDSEGEDQERAASSDSGSDAERWAWREA